MKKSYLLAITLAFILIGSASAEEITLTTYYPAPYGVYKELKTTDKTSLATDGGGVEIGTGSVSPSSGTKLTIHEGSILAEGTTGDTPVSGSGIRMMWIPAKGAFRAGTVDGTQWDGGNIGDYSIAVGKNTTASEDYSIAMGYNTTASGQTCTAMGNGAVASENNATSIGYMTTASGATSVAIGNQATANIDSAIAIGTGVEAQGIGALAMGNGTIASGRRSTAMGYRAKAEDEGCFVWSDNNYGPYSTDYYESYADHTFNVRASNGAFLEGTPWSDVAEFMDVLKADAAQEAELVSLFGNDKLAKSNGRYDNKLIGVVSSKRTGTLHLGDRDALYEDTERLPIALVGRVYVKVNSEGGPIKIGDAITSSSQAGVGMKADKTGRIVGYAMEAEDFTGGEEDSKEILVFVNVGYYVLTEDSFN